MTVNRAAACGAPVARGPHTTPRGKWGMRIHTPLTRGSVELTGFELVTPSLRSMQSNHCDQGQRRPSHLWRGCGTSPVRRRET